MTHTHSMPPSPLSEKSPFSAPSASTFCNMPPPLLQDGSNLMDLGPYLEELWYGISYQNMVISM